MLPIIEQLLVLQDRDRRCQPAARLGDGGRRGVNGAAGGQELPPRRRQSGPNAAGVAHAAGGRFDDLQISVRALAADFVPKA